MSLHFDLRSDTVTQPTAAMREAMAAAPVGDDVYREDPTMRRLEERVAEIVGKEAALFVPSGTMANQIAILCQTRPGDEIICGRGAHLAYYESGAAGAWAGVQFEQVGTGTFTADEVEAAIKPRAYYCPQTSLVTVENTHNRAGGLVFPQDEIERIAAVARRHELRLHLDGARIWNAAVASGASVESLAAPFDTVSVCFSKGLGAPVGSALCGDAATLERALRFRKMLGGGMRQAGILAAGALYALEHHSARLSADHEAARELARRIAPLAGVTLGAVETNIVSIDLPVAAERAVEAAARRGVLIAAVGPRRLRLVTHLGVVGEGFEAGVAALVAALTEAIGAA